MRRTKWLLSPKSACELRARVFLAARDRRAGRYVRRRVYEITVYHVDCRGTPRFTTCARTWLRRRRRRRRREPSWVTNRRALLPRAGPVGRVEQTAESSRPQHPPVVVVTRSEIRFRVTTTTTAAAEAVERPRRRSSARIPPRRRCGSCFFFSLYTYMIYHNRPVKAA